MELDEHGDVTAKSSKFICRRCARAITPPDALALSPARCSQPLSATSPVCCPHTAAPGDRSDRAHRPAQLAALQAPDPGAAAVYDKIKIRPTVDVQSCWQSVLHLGLRAAHKLISQKRNGEVCARVNTGLARCVLRVCCRHTDSRCGGLAASLTACASYRSIVLQYGALCCWGVRGAARGARKT